MARAVCDCTNNPTWVSAARTRPPSLHVHGGISRLSPRSGVHQDGKVRARGCMSPPRPGGERAGGEAGGGRGGRAGGARAGAGGRHDTAGPARDELRLKARRRAPH
jgi:hypothetical protein